MTDFERNLRRDGYAVAARGCYRIADLGDLSEVLRSRDGPGPCGIIPASTHATRESAIRWAVRDAGEVAGRG